MRPCNLFFRSLIVQRAATVTFWSGVALILIGLVGSILTWASGLEPERGPIVVFRSEDNTGSGYLYPMLSFWFGIGLMLGGAVVGFVA